MQGSSIITKAGQKTVAITGAAGGIGRELARQFAEAGYQVVAIGRDAARVGALEAVHERIHGFVADVADADACQRAFAQAEQKVGPIGVLIAGAAIYLKGHFLDQPANQLAETMRINVEGVANAIRPVLPGMLARNFGRVLVLGSLADMNPVPGTLAYAVSKGALHTLVQGIAREIDRERYDDVLINEFSPGATRTAMSVYGNDPADIYQMLIRLVECGPGGPQGKFFQEWREIRLGENWKAALKRLILRK